MLCTRFWATAYVNVDRSIEGNALFEIAGQPEGMTCRVCSRAVRDYPLSSRDKGSAALKQCLPCGTLLAWITLAQ